MAEAEHDQKTLLLVEDDEAFARTLRRSFERRGYKVHHATCLEQVEAAARGLVESS